MARGSAEMPFLDHLEELRSRILRSLLAVVLCFAFGIWLVNRFRLIDVLKEPITPFLAGGQLTVLSPTEPLMIVLKLGLIVGLVLASPVLVWQLWAFLSPALYEKEKKTLVPALFVGLALFLGGGIAAFKFIVPQALRVLMTVQAGSFNTMITFDAYFSFVAQVVLALGISCELPLLMIILAALGILSPPMLHKIRPYAIVGSFFAGALLSPGADVLSMFMLTIPLLLLYELGVAGVYVVHRRRLKAAAATGAGVFLLLALGAAPARAQTPIPPPPPRPNPLGLPGQRPPGDTTRVPGAGRILDSASARRLGLPSAPKQSFTAPDSVMAQLLELTGYSVTRFRADTARVQAIDNIVDLKGNAMMDRSASIVEAGSIRYREGECTVDADGEPHIFQGGHVLTGASARFDTCKERGVVSDALTNFNEGTGNWFVRGNLAIDSSQSRLYGGSAELTSCDLPEPHYSFSAKQIKWVSKSVIVARPVVLYIRDVPIAWLPFIFQDTKQGRRSGILIPQFGFNDIVRPTPGYNRQVTNIGYFWAPNDYFDALFQFDWFANRYITYGLTTNYVIRNRFINGGIRYSAQKETGGLTSHQIGWTHRQQFNNSTSLNLSVNYATNPSIVSRNSFDTRVSTGQIGSQASFTKRFSWGSMVLGGSGQQSINDGSVSLTAPSFTINPRSLDLTRNITWTPALSITNQNNYKAPLPVLLVPGAGGVDSVKQTGHQRRTSYSLNTPLRLWSFNWENSFDVVDGDSTGRYQQTFKVPDLSTPDPNDSVTAVRYRSGGFGSSLEWNTRFSLPIFFQRTWKLTPSVGVANAGPGTFAIRNAATNGQWVTQGKRFSLGLTMAPTFYGFFPGFARFATIRHSFSPSISYNYSPASRVSEAFARATTAPGQPLRLTTLPTQGISLSLTQIFEAKMKGPAGDTSGTSARKLRILGITTSGLSYDIEQAKEEGRTGWTNQSLSNQLSSDLLPGFNLSLTHDLWNGPVGYSTSKFEPFLSSVSTRFDVTGGTFRSIASLFGLAKRAEPSPSTSGTPVTQASRGVLLPNDYRRNSLLQPAQSLGRGGRPFTSTVSIDITRNRSRLAEDGTQIPGTSQSNIGFSTSFSPTQFWGLSWNTMYNATLNRFESQSIQLTRDLHEWRAAFNFQKAPNGNFAFYFSVFLSDLPALKFDYNQTTILP